MSDNGRTGFKILDCPDPYLNLTLTILNGIETNRRLEWMRRNMPHTLSMLSAASLYAPLSPRSYFRKSKYALGDS